MRSLSFFLAWRYLTQTTYHTNISLMTRIAFFGITIGTFALALVSAIMSGFEHEVHKKLQGIHPPITLQSYGQQLNAPCIKKVLHNEFPTIAATSASSTGYAIIYTESSSAPPDVVILRGIEPEYEAAISGIDKKIIGFEKELPTLLINNQVIIGKKLAENLTVKAGDTLEIAYAHTSQQTKKRMSLDTHTVLIAGLFDSGIDEFDSNTLFCSLKMLHTLFPDTGIQTIQIRPHDNANQKELIIALRNRLQLDVYSWQDLYPALVSALKLEKYAMFLILALITLVASMSIMSLLFMQITQKRNDIAILKTMGIPHNVIVRTFLLMGCIITSSACATGLLAAASTSWLLNTYPFITLPDTYYVSHLPSHFTWQLAATVAFLVLLIGLLASWIPAQKTRNLRISHVLRFEG